MLNSMVFQFDSMDILDEHDKAFEYLLKIKDTPLPESD